MSGPNKRQKTSADARAPSPNPEQQLPSSPEGNPSSLMPASASRVIEMPGISNLADTHQSPTSSTARVFDSPGSSNFPLYRQTTTSSTQSSYSSPTPSSTPCSPNFAPPPSTPTSAHSQDDLIDRIMSSSPPATGPVS